MPAAKVRLNTRTLARIFIGVMWPNAPAQTLLTIQIMGCILVA
jgi:hypothetical protein